MSAAFVPTFTRRLTRQGENDAWRFANNVLNTLIVVTAALVRGGELRQHHHGVICGMVFARPIVHRVRTMAFAGSRWAHR